MPAKLKAWEEQQACWESQRNELVQRVEDEAEKVDKIEKYGTRLVYQKHVNHTHSEVCELISLKDRRDGILTALRN